MLSTLCRVTPVPKVSEPMATGSLSDKIGYLARIAGRVHIGDIVGGRRERALIGNQSA